MLDVISSKKENKADGRETRRGWAWGGDDNIGMGKLRM